MSARSLLYVSGVSRSFDGFKAINNLSLYIQPRELRAIIGPNGAGKTTMMDIITGKTKPDEGEVYWQDRYDLTKYDEAEIANLGIGRKFQKPTVFETQTVRDNVGLALKNNRRVRKVLFYKETPEDAEKIDELLKEVELYERRDELAADLSHGQKQWLEIAMLLAQDPELLLIDEPAAGMTDAETMRTAALFKSLAQKHSLVVVEHDMDFIKALDCKVTVLHQGTVLAEGSLEHVSANEEVMEVYLGR